MAYQALWWLGSLLHSLADLVTWVCRLMQTSTETCAFGLCALSVCILTLATSEEQLLCCLAVDDALHLKIVIAKSVSVGRCYQAHSYKASTATSLILLHHNRGCLQQAHIHSCWANLHIDKQLLCSSPVTASKQQQQDDTLLMFCMQPM